MNYILFWAAKIFVELFIAIIIIALICILFIIPGKIKQIRCPHESYYENMACDAVCRKCGKTLGFIGELKDMENNNNGAK